MKETLEKPSEQASETPWYENPKPYSAELDEWSPTFLSLKRRGMLEKEFEPEDLIALDTYYSGQKKRLDKKIDSLIERFTKFAANHSTEL